MMLDDDVSVDCRLAFDGFVGAAGFRIQQSTGLAAIRVVNDRRAVALKRQLQSGFQDVRLHLRAAALTVHPHIVEHQAYVLVDVPICA